MSRPDGRGIFAGLSNPLEATRYRALIIEPGTLPGEFEVSARCDADPDEIMAIRHREQRIDGVQFHPESFLTDCGVGLLQNFLKVPPATISPST